MMKQIDFATIKPLLEAVAEEHFESDDYGGGCVYCGRSSCHSYECPTQHARILLGLPILMTPLEVHLAAAKAQELYELWAEAHPEEAERAQATRKLLLETLALPGSRLGLLDLVARPTQDEAVTVQWVEERLTPHLVSLMKRHKRWWTF